MSAPRFWRRRRRLRIFSPMKSCLSEQRCRQSMADALQSGGRIYSCGNGGSLCDAMHFAEEMTGRYRNNRPAYAATAIADASHMACVANDFGYEYVFSRYIEGVARSGDVLLGISTSGTSKNVLRAVEASRAKGVKDSVAYGARRIPRCQAF